MKTKLLLILLLLGTVAANANLEPPLRIKRFAFIVGQNDGGSKKIKLKYATSDASSVLRVMAELGGVDPDDSMLVVNPNRETLLNRFYEMERMIRSKRTSELRTELLFYYSGHSDDEGLLVQEDRIPYSDLRRRIQSMAADLSIIVLDSCASGNLTRIKGGRKAPPFLNDALSKLKGYVALTSSSSDEVAQESDRIRGSYFTHYLVSGLRGAADLSSDNRVTLNEAYQYAYHQTLARTEKTASGAQHPSYSIQLSGSGELVMTDIRKVSAKVVLDKDVIGRVFIRDNRDFIVAEVEKALPKPMAIGLEEGDYSLILFKEHGVGKAKVKLAYNQFSGLKAADFSPVEAETGVLRGTASSHVEEGELVEIPTEFSVLPGVSTNVLSSEVTSNNVAISLLYSRPAKVKAFAWSLLGWTEVKYSLSGVQLSPLYNKVGYLVSGVQIAAGYNVAERVNGAQIGAHNSSNSVSGVQIGGFNEAKAEIRGMQIGGVNVTPKLYAGGQLGVVNVNHSPMNGAQLGGLNQIPHLNGLQLGVGNNAKTFTGIQVAVLNHAESYSGAQIGAMNIASDVSGIQLGAVNYGASEEAVTVGLINLPRKGQFRFTYSFDDLKLHQVSLKYGTRYTYSFLQMGSSSEDRHLFSKSVGLGGDMPYRRTSLNLEMVVTRLDRNSFVSRGGLFLGQIRLAPRYRPTDWFAYFVGASLNVKLQRQTGDFSLSEPRSNPWIGYFAGLEFLI